MYILLLLCVSWVVQAVEVGELPFKIKGPKSFHDKIAIIGAGPSGVHMAYLLKQKGFKNIQILEKSSRIGGKSETIFHRGTPHDIGTVYLSPDYEHNVIKLVNKFVPDDLVSFAAASIWLDKYPGPITYRQYLGGFAMKLLRTNNQKLAGMKIVQAIMKYIKIHTDIFGKYEGEIMPEPTTEKLSLISGTFLQFIARNNLTVLLPIFQASTTMQGYGHLDEIAALYGLIWNTPTFMKGFLGRLTGKANTTGMYMLKSGFQNLWETMVTVEKLDVTFDVDIYRMYRAYKNDCQDVWMYKKEGNKSPGWEHFDFIIWSPEMKTSMTRWRNIIPMERKLFSSTSATYFTASVVDTENEKRSTSPINYWMSNVLMKRDDSVWAQRDSFSAINQYSGYLYLNGSYPTGRDNKTIKTSVVYQMSKNQTETIYLKNILRQHLEYVTMATDINILKMKTWRYFPRFLPADMEKGCLWRILEMQGKHAMWYIGSSVSFESVKSVVEYNKLIVRNMDMSNIAKVTLQ